MTKKNYKKVLIFTLILVLMLSVSACDAIGGGTGGNGEDQQQLPVQLPEDGQDSQEPEPTQPPPEPEPTQPPPEPEPTQAPPQQPPQPEPTQPPDSGNSDDIIRALLIILVVVIVLGAFIWIISNRFVDLVKAIGPVSILPTQSRIDFQARTIFASVYFKLESLEIQMVLPTIVQDARIIRVDTIGTDKYAHNIMINSLDDYDARFNAWLQEAYDLGSRTM
jgi:hypothetical protein